MLDINLLRDDIEQVAKNLAHRKFKLDIEYFQKLESSRKELQIKIEQLQAQRNYYSKQIGNLKSQNKDTTEIMAKVATIANNIKTVELEFTQIQTALTQWLSQIPNLLHDSVPVGFEDLDNIEIRRVGIQPHFDFGVRDHVDLGLILNRKLDFETAAKISGSRFVILKSQIAKLHRILAQFMLDIHTEEHGYTEIYVPYIVNSKAAFGTGQLPKFEEDIFQIKRESDNFYLIPTAEVPLTNMFADTILKIEDLPLKFVAHSPCFRSEAGSYGRDTRGMIRMHQFDKVEMVQITHPEKSFVTLEEITMHAENILKKLCLPYRVVSKCSGDTGFCATKAYDLEVWIPSQNTYREISSCSNIGDFQARRIQARFKNIQGKNELVHTLNGSGLAVGRTLVAILENYQNKDGSITIPDILRNYMQMDAILPTE